MVRRTWRRAAACVWGPPLAAALAASGCGGNDRAGSGGAATSSGGGHEQGGGGTTSSAASSGVGGSGGAAPVVADFFVATDGDDTWSGTLAAPDAKKADGPFATLAKAQSAVRAIDKSKRTTPIVVMVRAGTHPLASTLAFTAMDSGPPYWKSIVLRRRALGEVA